MSTISEGDRALMPRSPAYRHGDGNPDVGEPLTGARDSVYGLSTSDRSGRIRGSRPYGRRGTLEGSAGRWGPVNGGMGAQPC